MSVWNVISDNNTHQKTLPKYCKTGTEFAGSYRIRPSTKTYPPENHTQKLNRENTPMHKNHYPRGNHTCAHTKINRPSRKSYLCTKTDPPKQYQNHNLQTLHYHPLVASHAPSQKEGVVLCASVGATNQIVDF